MYRLIRHKNYIKGAEKLLALKKELYGTRDQQQGRFTNNRVNNTRSVGKGVLNG
jgi:hypothetical protein